MTLTLRSMSRTMLLALLVRSLRFASLGHGWSPCATPAFQTTRDAPVSWANMARCAAPATVLGVMRRNLQVRLTMRISVSTGGSLAQPAALVIKFFSEFPANPP